MKKLLFFLFTGVLSAQDTSYFLMGISKNLGEHQVSIRSGYSVTDHAHTLRNQYQFKISPKHTLSIGHNLNTKHKSKTKIENQFLVSYNYTLALGKNWRISNQNSYFLKMPKRKENMHLYRNRLGINYTTSIVKIPTQFFIQNEFFIHFNPTYLWRSQLTIGSEVKFSKVIPQLTYHYQDNHINTDRHLVSFSVTFPF